MRLVVPGKTFLVGEYAVLVGGKALGVATAPYFETHFDQQSKTAVHPYSAAGLLLKSKGQINLEIDAVVSKYGVGGFGQSTAEFIATWFKLNEMHHSEAPLILKNIFNEYRDLFDLSPDLKKIKPSGADLITQMMGKITYFDPEVTHSKSMNWVIPDLDFDIISTGVKVPTHDHLASLDFKGLEPLCDLSDAVLASYFSLNLEGFIELMKEWSLRLAELSLQHNHSTNLKNFLEKCPEVLAAKPNGALGADTITVFYNAENKNKIRAYFRNNNVCCVTGLDQLSQGAHYVD